MTKAVARVIVINTERYRKTEAAAREIIEYRRERGDKIETFDVINTVIISAARYHLDLNIDVAIQLGEGTGEETSTFLISMLIEDMLKECGA